MTHGVSTISRLQLWMQPIQLLMRDHGAILDVLHFVGEKSVDSGFDVHLFGARLTVGIVLIAQMGEQAEHLCFMPVPKPATRWQWWADVLAGSSDS